MTKEEKTKALLGATAGIREEYIEEAAAAEVLRKPWRRVAAIAAVLALVLGGILLYKPAESPEEPVLPLFGIRAYATDGVVTTLESVGDSSDLVSGESELFPGKQTYMLEIYLTNTDRSQVDLTSYRFLCLHEGRYLEPGDSDASLSILLLEEDGIYGYRIIGWCEDDTFLDITVRNAEDVILYQRKMRINYSWGYKTTVYTAYDYALDISTEELIDNILAQDYSRLEVFSSSAVPSYSSYASCYGGFQQLEQREDAASMLLQRWLQEMETKKDKLQYYASVDSTGLLGNMLAQDVYWNRLSEEEIQQIEQFGLRRRYSEPFSFFPGKDLFKYEIVVDGEHTIYDRLNIDWPGRTDENQREHIMILNTMSAAGMKNPFHGWTITGWFDEPTKMTLTVTDKDGNVIRRDVIVISPIVEGYDIRVLEQFP